MPLRRKVVLHSLTGYRPEFDELVERFIREGVIYLGIVGVDAALMEDIADELCVGDGSREPYSMLTAAHAKESLEEAIAFAELLTDGFSGEVRIVEL